jgi:hypothetical protein
MFCVSGECPERAREERNTETQNGRHSYVDRRMQLDKTCRNTEKRDVREKPDR